MDRIPLGEKLKILLLAHDLDRAKEWIPAMGLENPMVFDERLLAEQNPTRLKLGFYGLDYSRDMVEYTKTMVIGYSYKRPLVVLMDMRHQTAVDNIPHDISILFNDGSKSRRIAYNPTYKTQHLAQDLDAGELQKMLQISG